MKRVVQTRTGADGNCFAACLASILEISIASVPEFDDGWGWMDRANDFLSEHGVFYRRVPMSSKPSGYSTIEGISPRGGLHACVALDGELVWDPHPIEDGTGQGLVEPRYYGLLEPLLGVTDRELRTHAAKGLDEEDLLSAVIRKLGLTRDQWNGLSVRQQDLLWKKGHADVKRELRRQQLASAKSTDRADMLQLRKNTERQGGPFFMQETTKSGKERTVPVRELSKGTDDKGRCVECGKKLPANAPFVYCEPCLDKWLDKEDRKVNDSDRRKRLHSALDRILAS